MEQLTKVVNIHKEPYDVKIMRGTIYGNEFIIGLHGDRSRVVELHKYKFLRNRQLMEQARKELKGLRIGCCCKPLVCHGDIIAEICNMPQEEFEKIIQNLY